MGNMSSKKMSKFTRRPEDFEKFAQSWERKIRWRFYEELSAKI